MPTQRAPDMLNNPFAWIEADVQETANPPFILEPAGCKLPDNVKFKVYSRQRKPDEVAKDATQLERREYLLFSNDHPVYEFTAREDPATRWTRLYVGYEDPKTGKKDVVQTRKLIVRAIARGQMPPDPSTAGRSGQDVRAPRRATPPPLYATSEEGDRGEGEKRDCTPTMNEDGTPMVLGEAESATLDAIKSASAGMATRDELQASIDSTKPIPHANLEATEIQDVYKPEEIIGAEILNGIRIKDWQEACDKGEGVQLMSKFVASRLNNVARGPNSASRLRLLRYIYYLIVYYTNATRKRAGRTAMLKKDFKSITGASDTISDHFLRTFTNGRGEINSYYDSLMLTHALALASVLDGFTFDVQFLREDLKIDMEKFSTHFKEIGGRVKELKEKSTGRVKHVATLALPLQFPRQRRIRQRRN
ncbi:unnamed protein product [Parascedosporium putredinis]|uniref:Uncharacterized protein n=1 Tax=Parascedosporium putredinis TaxID=1442378 RepID=A0A9P1MEN3_9PEZI|nr:unnamed protein product [Parascedosporium putredinis]CAI8003119.1 unnamed protein product [Parascedosporium putredinis]